MCVFFFFVTFWHYKTLPRSTCVGSSPNLLDSAVVSRISGVFFVCLFACFFFFFLREWFRNQDPGVSFAYGYRVLCML